MGIGGQLPPEMILDSFRRQFVAGLVLYLDCDFIKKPIRDKYILVACVNPVHLYLVINTDPPPFTRQVAELLACQILISGADHPFLEHDSHVNCLEAYEIDQRRSGTTDSSRSKKNQGPTHTRSNSTRL